MNEENTAWTSLDLYYRGVHVKKSLPQNVQIEELVKTIDSYLAAGFEPSWNKETNGSHLTSKTPATGQPTALQADVSALCPIHGTQLVWKKGISRQTNKPYAFWACPEKNADGSYCKAGGAR